MANLARSAVTINGSWNEGGPSNKRVSARNVTMVLTGQGSVANAIPASVFELGVIEQATAFTASDNSLVIVAAPSADGSKLLLRAAGSNAPADFNTITLSGVVKGFV